VQARIALTEDRGTGGIARTAASRAWAQDLHVRGLDGRRRTPTLDTNGETGHGIGER
jgi:hypothetical protein